MGEVQALVLGIVQGLTEFLPVSSSGHLVLGNYWFGFAPESASLALAVTIATNTGTFLAVLVALRHDVALALGGFVRGLGSRAARREPGWRLALLVLVGSVPTAAIGLALRGVFEQLNAPLPVSFTLALTGVILWTAPQRGGRGGEVASAAGAPATSTAVPAAAAAATSVRHAAAAAEEPGTADASPLPGTGRVLYGDARDLTWVDALVAGLAQGLAVVPGISRSGATIAALLWRDVDAALAARLSFLLYLVASAGVAILGIGEVRGAGIGWAAVALMTVASFLTGWLALVWLFAVLRRGRFRAFAPYLWAVAALTLARLAWP